MNSIIRMFQDGGFFMYPILVFLVLAMAIAFERLDFLIRRANINATGFMAQIQKLIMANNIDRAIKVCNGHPTAALPRVVKAGLTRASRTEKEIENAIDEVTLEVVPWLNKRTNYLGMLANVATLTGLLGTIVGLIKAFDAVATAPPEMKSQMLAAGISMAMFTTAGGLVAAIPTLILHSIITTKTNKILDDVDQYGLKTLNLLSARRRGGVAEKEA
jgi:biopolymer transport protein ExbB